MNSITETGFLKIQLEISQEGPMNSNTAAIIQKRILEHLKKENLTYKSKFSYVNIKTHEIERSSGILDTSSRGSHDTSSTS